MNRASVEPTLSPHLQNSIIILPLNKVFLITEKKNRASQTRETPSSIPLCVPCIKKLSEGEEKGIQQIFEEIKIIKEKDYQDFYIQQNYPSRAKERRKKQRRN